MNFRVYEIYVVTFCVLKFLCFKPLCVHRPRSQHLAHLTNETATFTHGPSKPDYIVSTEHSPTKRIGMQPGHPPVFSSNFSTALTPATWQMARDGPPEPMPSHPHGFRYSPTKPGYRPQKPGLGSYGRRSPKMQHGRKQRASPYSFSKRAGELDHESQRLAKRPPPKRESGGKYPDDAAGPHKMYRPAFNRNIPGGRAWGFLTKSIDNLRFT